MPTSLVKETITSIYLHLSNIYLPARFNKVIGDSKQYTYCSFMTKFVASSSNKDALFSYYSHQDEAFENAIMN